MNEVHKRKLGKYLQIVEEYKSWGWQAQCKLTESFTGQSLCKLLSNSGVTNLEKPRLFAQ